MAWPLTQGIKTPLEEMNRLDFRGLDRWWTLGSLSRPRVIKSLIFKASKRHSDCEYDFEDAISTKGVMINIHFQPKRLMLWQYSSCIRISRSTVGDRLSDVPGSGALSIDQGGENPLCLIHWDTTSESNNVRWAIKSRSHRHFNLKQEIKGTGLTSDTGLLVPKSKENDYFHATPAHGIYHQCITGIWKLRSKYEK